MIGNPKLIEYLAIHLGIVAALRNQVLNFRACSSTRCKGTKFYMIASAESGVEHYYCKKCNYRLQPFMPFPLEEQLVAWREND